MPDQIEKNLILLLDPSGSVASAAWRFVHHGEPGRGATVPADTSEMVVHCFERHQLFGYLLCTLRAKLSRGTGGARRVLYLNDGNLSSLFDVGAKAAYPVFRALLLPPAHGLLQRVRRWLPPVLKADRRYVMLAPSTTAAFAQSSGDMRLPDGQGFMFFSNASGKLLLASRETLRTGGGLYKTAANRKYAEVMQKEYGIMGSVAAHGITGIMPKTDAPLDVGGRTYYPEEFVHGQNLRKVLHAVGRCEGGAGICTYLDRLDGWFQKFAATFQGERQSLTFCYRHMLAAFSSRYGADLGGGRILAQARSFLAAVDATHGGIRTGTAHNDLWPGNFVVRGDRFVAVDWERGAEKRAPIFDYYWMMISTALEYYVCRSGRCDYSQAFRLFLSGTDEVAVHADGKLRSFLRDMGFDQALHRQFMLLFLMEWSVQGFLALGELTAMDRLAYAELVSFCAGHADGPVEGGAASRVCSAAI